MGDLIDGMRGISSEDNFVGCGCVEEGTQFGSRINDGL